MKFDQQIFNSLQDAIFIFSSELQVLECNFSFRKLFKTEGLVFPTSFIAVNRNLEFHDFLKNAIMTNETSKLIGFTFETIHSPQIHYYDISCRPLENSDLFICILYDITERKNTEQIKEDFISNLSHEIKTPLTVLHGHIQVLKQELTTHPVIAKMEYNTTRMMNLCNDLLLLSSLEKKSGIRKEVSNIEDNILFLSQDLLINYPDKKIEFIFNLKQTEFYIDILLFEQVIVNLIDNSLKYGHQSGTISISSYAENDYDILTIEDTGPGIPEHQLHRIFERFYRGELSHSPTIKGTGLGLAIVKHIIQKHEAKIHVNSVLSVGTKFTLHFKKLNLPINI